MSQRAQRSKRNKTVILEKPPVDLQEARRQKKLATSGNKNRSLSFAYDETEGLGLTPDMRRSGPGMLSEQERKEILYKAYLNNVWISSCVDVIAKRITSGGYVIEEVKQGTGIESEKAEIDALLHYVNEDEDFLQLIRGIATDLGIYGEAYMEIVSSGGKPVQLHKVDCQTMSYKLDKYGAVVQYEQRLDHTQDVVIFQPEEIIRWWLPDPKASKKALSPIERILGPVDASAHMADWVRSFFRRGTRPNLWIKFLGPKNEAERFVQYLRENYTGAASAHVPLVTYDGAEVHEIGKGSIDIDFDKGGDKTRQEILAGYQVPPAIVSQIESGNIGGGTGESQEKSFQYNACDPYRQLIFEKFNYRIVQKGFKATTWTVNTHYADYRSDDTVTKVQDMRIRNGSNTINEVRREMGKEEIDGGDEAVVVASRDIIPVQRLADMADEQRQTAQVQLEQQATSLDAAKTRNEQMKANPQEQPNGQAPQSQPAPSNGQKAEKGAQKPAKESRDHEGGGYATGAAFALPDGGSFPGHPSRRESVDVVEADPDPEPLLDYNPEHDAWEPFDTDKQLADMEARGVKRLKWKSLKSLKGSCEKCIPNEGQVVELGQPFNSGARLAPQHPNCLCEIEEMMS